MYKNYFKNRGVEYELYDNWKMPKWLEFTLGGDKNISILDVGCGLGQFLRGCINMGYSNIRGIDLSEEAVEYCKHSGLNVAKVNVMEYSDKKFDFINMSHVLEHLSKADIISTLKHIHDNLLNKDGKLCIQVPNAQSNTDCYWAYEDFTHNTLFTAGSLLFVLREAGFEDIEFLDLEGLDNTTGWKRFIKRIFLNIYLMNKNFWNKVTGSSYHMASPIIFTWELKCVAYKSVVTNSKNND